MVSSLKSMNCKYLKKHFCIREPSTGLPSLHYYENPSMQFDRKQSMMSGIISTPPKLEKYITPISVSLYLFRLAV